MRWSSSPIVAIVITLGGVWPADAAPERQVVDRIVAVVDDECITQRELDREAAPKIEALGPDKSERDALVAAIRREALDRLVVEHLFAKEASRRSVRVAAPEIDAALDKVAAEQKVTRAELLKTAAGRGWSEAAYRTRIGRQLLEAKVLAIELATRDQRSKGPETDRAARMSELRKTVVAELRASAHIEEKL